VSTTSRPDYYNTKDMPDPATYAEELGLGFMLGNVIKYIVRAGRKYEDPLPDLKKARHYIDMKINLIENERRNSYLADSSTASES
jgi:hypothetical protein